MIGYSSGPAQEKALDRQIVRIVSKYPEAPCSAGLLVSPTMGSQEATSFACHSACNPQPLPQSMVFLGSSAWLVWDNGSSEPALTNIPSFSNTNLHLILKLTLLTQGLCSDESDCRHGSAKRRTLPDAPAKHLGRFLRRMRNVKCWFG